MRRRFSYRARPPDWPVVPGVGWPIDEIPVRFSLGGSMQTGILHHESRHTVWVRYQGHVIKRHRVKHQVDAR